MCVNVCFPCAASRIINTEDKENNYVKSSHLSVSDGKDPERFAWPRRAQHGPEKCKNGIDNGQQAASDHGIQDHCKVAQQF